MRIVVDQDEVLFQFVNGVLNRWNREHGTSFTPEHINMWHMEETLGPGSVEFIDRLIAEPGFFENLEPIPGAVAGFNRLIEMGHDVVVATSVVDCELVFDGKRRSMKKHFPKWPMKNFIACSRKGLLTGDYLIDDGEHNIKDWLDSERGAAMVFDAAWNRNIPTTSFSCMRVKDWDGIVSYFDQLRRNEQLMNDWAAERARSRPSPQNNRTPWR